MEKIATVFHKKIKTLWNFKTNLLMTLLEKLLIYMFKLSFLASESCFNLSLLVPHAAWSFSDNFLVRLVAFLFLPEFRTSSLTSSWMIISIPTSRSSSNSSTRVLSLSFWTLTHFSVVWYTSFFLCWQQGVNLTQ